MISCSCGEKSYGSWAQTPHILMADDTDDLILQAIVIAGQLVVVVM